MATATDNDNNNVPIINNDEVNIKKNNKFSGIASQSILRQHLGAGFLLLGGLTPMVQSIRRKNLNLNRFFRNTWLSSTFIGLPLGAGAGYVRIANSSEEQIRSWYLANLKDEKLIKLKDYSIIGGTLASLIVPTITLRRVLLLNGLIGGFSIGSVIGGISSFAL